MRMPNTMLLQVIHREKRAIEKEQNIFVKKKPKSERDRETDKQREIGELEEVVKCLQSQLSILVLFVRSFQKQRKASRSIMANFSDEKLEMAFFLLLVSVA